ncbi:angiopoietin-related protein 4 [Boleophthalmus pectinirostris]|uniref:angiopoietin-related protein 4 n=1 Tax=Boleophthalmus pectinirostris TaxID=150288 RepID=UPI00243260FA|nr:angiopoietin-related protein 4 [Boleophthalmus pectinirostris]
MKTSLAVLILCIVPLLTTSFPFERKGGSSTSGGGKEKRVQYAAWDDVNVLAHGLLQLGQGLKEHVDKTKVQIRDISTKLKIFNRTVTEFGKESQKLQQEGEALKARARGLEDREGRLLNVTVELRDRAEEMQLDRRTLVERVSRLEEKVEGLVQTERNGTDARHIQLMLEAQNKRIDDLMERIRLQQEKLDKQNVRIRTLQSQIQQSRQRGDVPRSPSPDAVVEQRDSPAADTASDCHELFLRGETTSGVYTVQPFNSEPFQVYCEMTPAGGWTVIQRRQDGSVDFHQPWEAYERGFGNLNGEFWLGLEKMHSISKDGGYVLNIAMSDWNGDLASVRLPFTLGGPSSKYALYVKKEGPFSPLESSLGPDANALPFSTFDQDNDLKSDANCAMNLSGGWWFSSCGQSNLNGRYFQSPPPKQRHQRKQGIFWKTWRGRYYPLRSTSIMMAPAEIQENRSRES